MNLILQQQLAEVAVTSGSGTARVGALKELHALGDEMDDSIFDPWINKSTGGFKGSSNTDESTEVIFSPTPVQEEKPKATPEQIEASEKLVARIPKPPSIEGRE